jgi:endonuclease YncB( thermonuclease family)
VDNRYLITRHSSPKRLILPIVIAAAYAPAHAQLADSPCSPELARSISQSYTPCKAKVVDVVDGRTLTVRLDGECRVRDRVATGIVEARLVQLELPTEASVWRERSRDFLASRVLASRVAGESIELDVSPYQDGHGVVAMVRMPDDLSAAQLEAGLASYRDFGPYAVDSYLECVYTHAESRARAAGSGIWSSPRPSGR